jgi:hypothetical protein
MENRSHERVYSDLNSYAIPERSVGSFPVKNINICISGSGVEGFFFELLTSIVTTHKGVLITKNSILRPLSNQCYVITEVYPSDRTDCIQLLTINTLT